MPATPARIGFIINQYRRAIAGPDASVVSKYGASARDTEEPIETFFDSDTDAQVLADERLALLSPDRRLLSNEIAGASHGLTPGYQPTLATAAVVDDERGYDADALVVRIDIDCEADRSTFLTWG